MPANFRAMFPMSPQSPTAAKGKGSVKHKTIFSSIVVAYGGGSQQKMFTVPQAQTIPEMKSSAITVTATTHHLVHSDLTTSLQKAGEFGNSIGDVSVRGISICFESAPPLVVYDGTKLGYDSYGATPQEVAEALNKIYFELKVGGVAADGGTLWMFPAMGGLIGNQSISTTANDTKVLAGLASNGPMAAWPRKRIPIKIARGDTVEGVFNTGNGATLVHRTSSGYGQPYLLFCALDSLVFGDVRG